MENINLSIAKQDFINSITDIQFEMDNNKMLMDKLKSNKNNDNKSTLNIIKNFLKRWF